MADNVILYIKIKSKETLKKSKSLILLFPNLRTHKKIVKQCSLNRNLLNFFICIEYFSWYLSNPHVTFLPTQWDAYINSILHCVL